MILKWCRPTVCAVSSGQPGLLLTGFVHPLLSQQSQIQSQPCSALSLVPPPTLLPQGGLINTLGHCSRKEISLPSPLQSCFSGFAGFLHTALPVFGGSWLPWLGEEQPGPAYPPWGWERTGTGFGSLSKVG